MDTGVVVIIAVVIAIISFANKMRKSWDTNNEDIPQPYASQGEELPYDSPYTHESREPESYDVFHAESLESMPILDKAENFKFTQYTPPVFIPTTGSFEAVSPEDDLISSFDYDEQNKESHVNTITDFDLKKAVIYSEILKPKWND